MRACDDGSFDTAKIIPDLVPKHALLTWTSLRPGDMVGLGGPNGQKHVGRVETGTTDGLIIWIRTDLNERKMFHFHDCESIQLIRSR